MASSLVLRKGLGAWSPEAAVNRTMVGAGEVTLLLRLGLVAGGVAGVAGSMLPDRLMVRRLLRPLEVRDLRKSDTLHGQTDL